MRVAVIGGGASGLITAYLLHKKYEVHVFEKENILGGNVRTLNRNVKCSGLDKGVYIENGVLGFNQFYYPNFHRLMTYLDVELITKYPSIALYHDQKFYPSNPRSLFNYKVFTQLITNPDYISSLLKLNRVKNRFLFEASENKKEILGDVLPNNELFKKYIKSLMMLSFSTPYENTEDLPAELCIPFITALKHGAWSFVKGGVYKYLEVILSKFSGTVYTGDGIDEVTRGSKIKMKLKSGKELYFDKVIFATTPGQISRILKDAEKKEKDSLNVWEDRRFHTTAHTDFQFYKPYLKTSKTPMDFFHNYHNEEKGYNTYMNNGYEINSDSSFSFSYQMEQKINLSHILDQQNHIVPVYNIRSWNTRKQIHQLNGYRNTYYVGAYLGNGLHEGAVTSALAVSKLLGGQIL